MVVLVQNPNSLVISRLFPLLEMLDRDTKCAVILGLFVLVSISHAAPIVLQTVRHSVELPSLHKRDSLAEHKQLSESLVNDLETYAVEIGIGSKNYRVVIDSASADLLVYSPSCPKANCPGPAVTSSAKPAACAAPLKCPSCSADDNACMFSQSFGDGSSCSGNVIKEKVTFADELSANAFVGMIETATGGADNKAFFANESLSGIFGLLPTTSTSNYHAKSPVWSLIESNKLPNTLVLCLRPAGGALILGEDVAHTRTNYDWTAMTSRTLYTVKLTDVGIPRKKIDGSRLGFSADAILDSATTNIVFPASLEKLVKDTFKSHCRWLKMKGICDSTPSIWTNYVQLTNQERVKFPNLVFYIDGLSRPLAISPNQYMTEYNGYYIMNIDFQGERTILGNGFMKNFRIVVDLDNHKIGFGDMRTCPGGPTPARKTDEDTYRILVNTSFTGFQFADPDAGFRYASMCGGVKPDVHCASNDAKCAAAGATKPLWEEECDYASALGRGIEVEARFGQPVDRSLGQAVLGTRDIAMPVNLPIDKPFLFATLKYWNAPVKQGTSPTQIVMRTTVDFTTPHEVDEYAAFTYDVTFDITHYGTCFRHGCPWNDPASWPNHLRNYKCQDGVLPDGTPCCPYWTTENAANQCSSVVELHSDYDVNMPAAELNGELFKIFFIGFHEDSHEHRSDRRLYNFFSADVGALTAANLHARLIPMCPKCPPGTTQTVHKDGSCTCQCATSCELPLVGEPDCSCIERISHDAACNYFCDAKDRAAIPCHDGELYVVSNGGKYRGLTLPPTPPDCGSGVPFVPTYGYGDIYYYDDYYGPESDFGSCGYYSDMHCECVCNKGCPAGTVQNSDCTCACAACPTNKYPGENCACLCSVGCPAGHVQNPDTCACSCPAACPTGKAQTPDCGCVCPGGCPAGHIQNGDCSCSCPSGCPAGQVQHGDCSCSCPAGCPAGQVQKSDCSCSCPSGCAGNQVQKSDCSCSCPAGCPSGQRQDPVSCACSCPSDCPAGKVQDTDCSCSCPSGCPTSKVQNSDCSCSCAAGCPAGKIQNSDCSCSCPSGCNSPLVQNSDCSCSCPSGCPAGRVQDPTSCHCSCSNKCSAPKLKLDATTCECGCPNSCSAPFVQDDATCACKCPNACGAGMVQNADTCECTPECTVKCAAPKTLNTATCSCDCPAATGCPANKVQSAEDCSCSCVDECPASKVQGADCSCSCPFTCAAGQRQSTADCSCSCATGCPAGKVRDAEGCGCHCENACSGARSTQNPDTCECGCPNACPAGQRQSPNDCSCSCPNECPAGQVRAKEGCGCTCEKTCTSPRSAQDPTTCECGCPTVCAKGQRQDPTTCACSCPNTCAEGFVLNPVDCSCSCKVECGEGMIQDPKTCACRCEEPCPEGLAQSPDTCACFCAESCHEDQVREANGCGCRCAVSCIGAANVQDPDSCECLCPNECKPGQRQNAQTCECACVDECPARMIRSTEDCSCHCNVFSCPEGRSMNPDTCECECPPARCAEGFVADEVNCGCKCDKECAAPLVLNEEECTCACRSACEPGQTQAEDCSCSCPNECTEGMIQTNDCSCTCAKECPAGQVRDESGCGCHCDNTCNAPMRLNPDTCACACAPDACTAPFIVDDATCACNCPAVSCSSPKTVDSTDCKCKCPNACAAPGMIQNADDCSCACDVTLCGEEEVLDDSDPTLCACIRRSKNDGLNKGAIIGGALAGAAALAALVAAAFFIIRSRLNSAPENYQMLGDDSGLNHLVDNPAFRDTQLAVNNPAFGRQ